MDRQSQRSFKSTLSRIVISLVLIVHVASCFELALQLSLKMEPTLVDFDKYLENFIADNKNLALLLDYDGTLAPIAPHPNLTHMTDETKSALNRIADNSRIFTAVISGRGVDDVKAKIGLNGVVYAGNHGLEILYPNSTRYNQEIPGSVSGNYDKMVKELEKITRSGSWIENKGVSLTFHYRAMAEDQHDMIRDEAKFIIEGFGYRANQAHCAIEAKPPVHWHKGKAAEYILSHNFGEEWRSTTKVVFAGDDTTDEDVCEILKGVGVTFRVTADPNLPTKATYRVPSTRSITTLLNWIDQKFSN
uniref:Trehalose 6-phosphate phosphatase n=1 Tax=Belgica antarctica TaxID=315563 RepID=J9WJW8_9DIPT|nr:trehalose-6-phosphate phosphatase [Belgica antarctica]